MGVKYICRKCGFDLFSFTHVGQDFYGVRTPSEIILMYNGSCPKCGNRLSNPSINDIKFYPKSVIINEERTKSIAEI